MPDPRCNGYPSVLYHHKLAPQGKTFNSEEEVRVLGSKWVDSPAKFPRQSKYAAWLKTSFKPWWAEWEWSAKAITVLLGTVGAIILFASKFFG